MVWSLFSHILKPNQGFYAPRSRLSVRAEYPVFDLGNLVGEVCGFGGVLLGFSVLTLYDEFLDFADWLGGGTKRLINLAPNCFWRK